MFCSKCGSQQPDGAVFCGSCGAPLSQAPKPAATPAYTASPAPRAGAYNAGAAVARKPASPLDIKIKGIPVIPVILILILVVVLFNVVSCVFAKDPVIGTYTFSASESYGSSSSSTMTVSATVKEDGTFSATMSSTSTPISGTWKYTGSSDGYRNYTITPDATMMETMGYGGYTLEITVGIPEDISKSLVGKYKAHIKQTSTTDATDADEWTLSGQLNSDGTFSGDSDMVYTYTSSKNGEQTNEYKNGIKLEKVAAAYNFTTTYQSIDNGTANTPSTNTQSYDSGKMTVAFSEQVSGSNYSGNYTLKVTSGSSTETVNISFTAAR